jgi:hypothetical protein
VAATNLVSILYSYWTLCVVGPWGDGGLGQPPLPPYLRHGPATIIPTPDELFIGMHFVECR